MYAASNILGFRQQNGLLFISAVNLVSDGNEEKSYYYYYYFPFASKIVGVMALWPPY